MGWLGNFWSNVRGLPQEDLVFVSSIELPGATWTGQPIIQDDCYIEIYVESLRLHHARRFASTFHGVAYLFATMAREGAKNAELAAVSKPAKLAELDKSSLDKVITVSKQMMGAIPWRGGDLQLQLGLFSVKSGNLLSPALDFVTQISTVAGVSFVGQVATFVPLITQGMELIAGQNEDTELEVAIDTTIKLDRSGLFAIIDVQKGKIDPAKVKIDPVDMKLLNDGKPIEHGYCVFSIRKTDRKADFGEIPELREKFTAVQMAIRANDMQRAKDALIAFRLEAIVSPDLIPADASALVNKVEQRVREAFQSGGISRNIEAYSVEPLSSVSLYE